MLSVKGPGEMDFITSKVNAHVYTENVDNFLISSVEIRFGDEEEEPFFSGKA